MIEKSLLQKIAEGKRAELLPKNRFNSGNIYSSTHPDATTEVGPDDPANVFGRGTGVRYDTSNGGNSIDMLARADAFAKNVYSPQNPFRY
jgi:hypothetical protein